MKKLGKKGSYFSKGELALWFASVVLIIASFVVFDRKNFLTLAASLVGVTSLVFNAKGNPTGQLLMIVFSVLYGIISWEKAYYGEMLTYRHDCAYGCVCACFLDKKSLRRKQSRS